MTARTVWTALPIAKRPERLTLAEAFQLLWDHHLAPLASGKTYIPNRKALIRSFGGKHLDEITPFDFRDHRQKRLAGTAPHKRVGLWTVYHDHGLIHLSYEKLDEWKTDGLRPGGVDLSALILPQKWPTYKSKKTKGPKRKVIANPEEFLAICQEAPARRLVRTLEALNDLDIRQGDLRGQRPENYNPYTDQVEWIQSKTGKENCVPVTDRVRRHFIEAREQGREFVYDLTNLHAEYEEAREAAAKKAEAAGNRLLAARIRNLTRRDMRKTSYNVALRHTGSHHLAGMLAGHSSTRTGIDHYEIEFREDLRPVVAHLEKMYPSK